MGIRGVFRGTRGLWVLGLLLLLWGCTPGQAQVGGVVRDASGAPVEGARVWLGDALAHTNERGEYVFGDVRPGERALVILADGYRAFDRVLHVQAGPQRVDAALEPKIQAPEPKEATGGGDRSAPEPEPAEPAAVEPASQEPPRFKLPLPGGLDWLLSTEPGGKFYGGSPNPGHTGRSHFSFDLIDNNRQQGELSGKRPVPVLAAAGGTVVEVRNSVICQGCEFGYGNYVKLDHGNGFTTTYGHLRYPSVTVRLGERVRQGQVLGFMGNTGHSTGIHLHFEVRYRDQGAPQSAVLNRVLMEGIPLSQYKVGTVSAPRYYRSTQEMP